MSAAEDMNAALLSLLSRDQAPPCADGPDPVSEDAEVREAAAPRCRLCPIRQTCADFGDEIKATFGVYGGTDRSPRSRPKGRPKKEQAA